MWVGVIEFEEPALEGLNQEWFCLVIVFVFSTGKLEAINCKIGTLQRNAYGYRDDEYLKLRIFNLHNSIYALTG